MKRKIFTLAMASFLMLAAGSVQAQDKRSNNTEIQQDHERIKEIYKQRKQAIHDAYKNDMARLGAKSGLSATERREQRRMVQERFNQQKKELQAAYKADQKALQAKRKSLHEMDKEDKGFRRDSEVRNERSNRGKAIGKHSKGKERSFEKGQGQGKGNKMAKGKGGKRS